MTIHELCDDILKTCRLNSQLSYAISLQQLYAAKGINVNQLEGALNFLSNNPPAYLSKNVNVYVLTPAGEYFLECGGYAGQQQREREAKELANNINQSVLETNNSVRRTHTFQKWTTIATIIVILCAFLISLLNYLRYDDKSPVLLLQQQQVNIKQDLDSLKILMKAKVSQDTLKKNRH
jgi:hypothetical protein